MSGWYWGVARPRDCHRHKEHSAKTGGPRGLQGSSVAEYGLRVLGLRVYGRRWRGAYGASGLAGRECLRFLGFQGLFDVRDQSPKVQSRRTVHGRIISSSVSSSAGGKTGAVVRMLCRARRAAIPW